MKSEVNKTKYIILKGLLTVKGFYRTLAKFKNGGRYIGGAKKCPSIYAGRGSFYEAISVRVPGTYVEYSENKLVKYPYWQLGIFDWTEINEEKDEER